VLAVQTHQAGTPTPWVTGSLVRRRLVLSALTSLGLCATVLATSMRDTTPLGAPPYWPWGLTGLQVIALWSAGTGRWWGWLLGGSVQLPWIAYAVVTGQWGFIPGCAISASVQIHNFVRAGALAAGPPDPRTALTPGVARTTEVR
jgi:hypothetical protein